jgi:hypothetical protein
MVGYIDILITAVLTLGATARVTRLIAIDSFPFRPLRDWALTRGGENGWLPTLLECPWCVGVWVSAPATASAYLWGHTTWWQLLAAWMSLAFLASALVVTTND